MNPRWIEVLKNRADPTLLHGSEYISTKYIQNTKLYHIIESIEVMNSLKS